MSVEQDPSALRNESEIDHLVESAREFGEDDGYAGKRHWTRYRAGMRLEVTTDPANPAATMAVVMEDASNGGCAFWSRRELGRRRAVYVRRFPADDESDWMPAVVHHCTVGIRGFLIGVSFKSSAREEALATRSPSKPISGHRVAETAGDDPAKSDTADPKVGQQDSAGIANKATSLPNRSGLLRRLRRVGGKK